MSAKTVLLVSGSRALTPEYGGTRQSYEWAWDTLQWRITGLHPGDRVLNGGAKGPDQMSSRIACAYGIELQEYRLSGWVYCNDPHSAMHAAHRWRDAEGPVISPLERNRALVAAAVRCREEGWRVHVLALIAPWAKTGGTLHTAAQAEHSGLEVTRLTCPAEYGGDQ